MPEPADLLGVWERVVRDLRGVVAAGTEQTDAGRLLGTLVQRQADLLEGLLERQRHLEEEVVGRALAPVNVLLDVLEQSHAAMRAQARALDAASKALEQASDLFDVQAGLLERASQSLRDPVAVLRSAGAAVTRREPPADDG